jgi:hypothetical protein
MAGLNNRLVEPPVELIRDRAGEPLVYMLCEPATRYFQVMTRAQWMPVLVDEVI